MTRSDKPVNDFSQLNSQLNQDEIREWQLRIADANRHNIFCHCHQCQQEWIASAPVPCQCGSTRVEYIACWQFPDD